MIIIRNNSLCSKAEHEELCRKILRQALNGLIVLPEYCELLHIDPGDPKVGLKFTRLVYGVDEIPGSPDLADPV